MDVPRITTDCNNSTKERTLKADPFAQLSLLDLQAQDSTLAQLTHRKNSLPEIATISDLSAKAAELNGQRVEADTQVSDLSREQKKADLEVEQVRSRRIRDEERMNSGQISNPKDLEKMQHEIVALDRRIGTLEDEELEVMEALEEAQNRLDAVTSELADLTARIDAATLSRDAKTVEIDKEAHEVIAERKLIAEKVPDDLTALYDKLRAQYGTGAAPLKARRCEGCRLELNGADLREIAEKPSNEVIRCPECTRILVRTLESGI
ncbi:MAG: C4-type zinc ribbon domain-containing protein [Aeromicrobium sp.]